MSTLDLETERVEIRDLRIGDVVPITTKFNEDGSREDFAARVTTAPRPKRNNRAVWWADAEIIGRHPLWPHEERTWTVQRHEGHEVTILKRPADTT